MSSNKNVMPVLVFIYCNNPALNTLNISSTGNETHTRWRRSKASDSESPPTPDPSASYRRQELQSPAANRWLQANNPRPADRPASEHTHTGKTRLTQRRSNVPRKTICLGTPRLGLSSPCLGETAEQNKTTSDLKVSWNPKTHFWDVNIWTRCISVKTFFLFKKQSWTNITKSDVCVNLQWWLAAVAGALLSQYYSWEWSLTIQSVRCIMHEVISHRVLTTRDKIPATINLCPHQTRRNNQSNITANQKRVWAEPLWKRTALAMKWIIL